MGKKKVADSDGREPVRWQPKALDGGYGWAVVFGSFCIHVFADGFVYSFGVIAESLVSEFKATNAETSLILSLLTGLMLAAGPIASAVCNRIGCRLTTIIGAIIASIGCASSYFAYSMNYLLVSVGIVMGFGFGMMYCPAIVIVTMYFEKYRSLATGVTVCGAGVGTAVFSKIIGFLIVHFNWRTVFLIYAGVVLLCIPCGALYRPIAFEPIYNDEDKKEEEEEEEKEKTKAEPKKNGIVSNVNNHLAVGGIRSAVSHTGINEDPKENNLQRVRSLGGHLHKTSEASVSSLGYLNVKDVFYGRSVTELKDYNEKIRSVASLPLDHKDSLSRRKETHHSNVDILKELPEEDENDDSTATSASRAIEMWRVLKKMLDLSLFTDPVYVLFAASNFLTSIGFNGPPMYMPMNAENILKVSKQDAATTVSAFGLANLLGRIVFGMICDRELPFKYGKDTTTNRLWIYNWTLMFNGIACCFVFMMTDFNAFLFYCFSFGFLISSYVCLTSVVLVDLIGVEKLTNAFGLLLLVQGIATVVGPPIAGVLYDITGNYDWTFLFCGVCLFLSGAMMFAVPCLKKKNEKDVRLEDPETTALSPMVA
ncbi:unnamed protein product [Bursaphelenchus okinawaensis]|uniref:Major facilitator superfamily (MFS) profile domain-containing protein n=1 Tax=Bursaphelenchus okinawaensis TaxID=465554 RepID=A0A811LMP2_9BILA|nr:unnamed protein product [Bursaphelenchus okinawaensis]CAG9126473.1 unnamed protein product [Bursaphelenchus okinawaensis]